MYLFDQNPLCLIIQKILNIYGSLTLIPFFFILLHLYMLYLHSNNSNVLKYELLQIDELEFKKIARPFGRASLLFYFFTYTCYFLSIPASAYLFFQTPFMIYSLMQLLFSPLVAIFLYYCNFTCYIHTNTAEYKYLISRKRKLRKRARPFGRASMLFFLFLLHLYMLFFISYYFTYRCY